MLPSRPNHCRVGTIVASAPSSQTVVLHVTGVPIIAVTAAVPAAVLRGHEFSAAQ